MPFDDSHDDLILMSSSNGEAFTPGRLGDLTLSIEGPGLIGFAEGDGVDRWPDRSIFGNDFVALTNPAEPTYRHAAIGGLPALEFDGILNNLHGPALSGLIAAAAYTIFIVASVHTIHTDDATPYNNDALLSDTGGYFGLHLRRANVLTSTPPRAVAYNWSGDAPQSVEIPIPLDAPILITQQHRAGSLSISLNAGAASSTPSGSTDSLAGLVELCQGSSSLRPAATVAAAFAYAAGVDAGDMTKMKSYLGRRYGIF